MSNWEILQALVFEPRKAFAAIAERPKWLFPALLLIVATVGLVVWYLGVVDLAWVTDQQLHQSSFARQMSEEQIAAMVKAASSRRGLQMVSSGVIYTLVIAIFLVLGAVYLLLAGKITNVQRTFQQWFAFTCWTSLPTALAAIPAAIVLLTSSTTQISQGDLQPLSLNALLFHRAPTEPGYALLTSFNLLQLLSVYLSVLGVKLWSGRSWLFSFVFAALPLILIYGIWAFFAFR